LWANQDQKYHRRVKKINERYEKQIQEHKEYFRRFKEVLHKENFRNFLEIQNRRLLEYQIESKRIHRKVESQFLKIYEEKLSLERELGQLEQTTNRQSDLQFSDITKQVEQIIKASNFNFKNLNPSRQELENIYKMLENVERNLNVFDEAFQQLKDDLTQRLAVKTASAKSYIALGPEILEVSPDSFWETDPVKVAAKILKRIVTFQSVLVR